MRVLPLLLVALAACNSPTLTEPGASGRGRALVVGLDESAVEAAIEGGFARAATRTTTPGALDRLRVDGLRVVAAPWLGPKSVGKFVAEDGPDGTIYALPGVEVVVAHELQHWIAWRWQRPLSCRALQDHSPGYDLDCNYREKN